MSKNQFIQDDGLKAHAQTPADFLLVHSFIEVKLTLHSVVFESNCRLTCDSNDTGLTATRVDQKESRKPGISIILLRRESFTSFQ